MDLQYHKTARLKKANITSSTVKLQVQATKTCFSFCIIMDNAIYALVSAK